MYHIFLDNDSVLKSSQHLFAVQLAKQCYIGQGYDPSRLSLKDDDGNSYPDTSTL